MGWFPVDDGFHAHPKARAATPAAIGLWTMAGSWCQANPKQEGKIPEAIIPGLLPRTQPKTAIRLADELVRVGLWKQTASGYVFKDWFEWGSKRTAREMRALSAVRSKAGRAGGIASGNTRRNQRSKPEANNEAKTKPPGPIPCHIKTPLPPAASGRGTDAAHNGQHPNCRECGTNPRGRPKPTRQPPPVAAVLGRRDDIP